eukprot:s1436_g13.t1
MELTVAGTVGKAARPSLVMSMTMRWMRAGIGSNRQTMMPTGSGMTLEAWTEKALTMMLDTIKALKIGVPTHQSLRTASRPVVWSLWVDAYAAYLDARKRFNDLPLSRGILPVVALEESNIQPGTSSPSRSSGSPKGGSRKGKKGKGKSKDGKPNIFQYNKAPTKPAQPQRRAQSECLRYGQKAHFAAKCRQLQQEVCAGPATESMAKHSEGALVAFKDKHGHERTDVAMLDSSASAFLCGYGPMS